MLSQSIKSIFAVVILTVVTQSHVLAERGSSRLANPVCSEQPVKGCTRR